MLNFIKRIRIRKERTELFRGVQAFVRVRFHPKHEVQYSLSPDSQSAPSQKSEASEIKFSLREPQPQANSDIKYSLRDTGESTSDIRYSLRSTPPSKKQKPRVVMIDGVLTYLDGDSDMPTFTNKVKHLMSAQGLTGPDLCKRIMMDRRLWSKLNSDSEYQPSKETAMAICIGLRLNIEQAQDLLGSAGYTLSDTRKQDVVMCYFFENGIYDIDAVNDILDRFGFKCLGTNLRG